MFLIWNSSVPGKWRMLTDLRAVNGVIVPIGVLLPGLHNPSMILRNYHLFVIDLKGCFSTIALHPDDKPRFAFSVSFINLKESHKRFQWTVLSQAMLSDPSICQSFVAKDLHPV